MFRIIYTDSLRICWQKLCLQVLFPVLWHYLAFSEQMNQIMNMYWTPMVLSYSTPTLLIISFSYKINKYYSGCNVQYDDDSLYCWMIHMKVFKTVDPKSSYHKEKICFSFSFFPTIYVMIDVNKIYWGNHFMIYVSQIIMLHTLNLYNGVCQLYLKTVHQKLLHLQWIHEISNFPWTLPWLQLDIILKYLFVALSI